MLKIINPGKNFITSLFQSAPVTSKIDIRGIVSQLKKISNSPSGLSLFRGNRQASIKDGNTQPDTVKSLSSNGTLFLGLNAKGRGLSSHYRVLQASEKVKNAQPVNPTVLNKHGTLFQGLYTQPNSGLVIHVRDRQSPIKDVTNTKMQNGHNAVQGLIPDPQCSLQNSVKDISALEYDEIASEDFDNHLLDNTQLFPSTENQEMGSFSTVQQDIAVVNAKFNPSYYQLTFE